MRSDPPVSVMQSAAVLLLCRLFLFFCSNRPYTAAYAAGTAAAAALQGVLIILLLHRKIPFGRSALLFSVLRIAAVLWAIRLTAAFFTLYCSLHLPHPAVMLLLLIPVLLYTVSLPARACTRTGTVLLTAGCLGFLLLPVSGIRTAHPAALFAPDSFSAAFLLEWLSSGDLLLLPLLAQTRAAARRTAAVRTAGTALFLPALILFGAMQNVRLTQFSGNPFFLLLARTPLSDAVRVDGFWMLFAFCCGVFCITACYRFGLPPILTGKERP